MKAIIFSIAAIFWCDSIISDKGIDEGQWNTSFEIALRQAQKNEKNILMYFTGSDWCGPCKMLKTDLFDTPEFQELSKNYILLYIDIPRREDILTPAQKEHNTGLLKRFNKKGVFPLLLAMSPKGKILDEHSGYGMNGDTQYYLQFLKKNQ